MFCAQVMTLALVRFTPRVPLSVLKFLEFEQLLS